MELSVGAVGAAVIAGLVSILGLIISKEQKISEFRQAWIDELRKCLILYVANLNAVADALHIRRTDPKYDLDNIAKLIRSLNEASHGIYLRLNEKEPSAKELMNIMKEFEALAKDNKNLTAQNITKIEANYIIAAQKLLKTEWRRVKRGESTFVWVKYGIIVITLGMILFLGYILAVDSPESVVKNNVKIVKIIK